MKEITEQYNIYRIETSGEVEWIYVSGNNIVEALKFYLEETLSELSEVDSITLLPREEWKNKTIRIECPLEEEEDIVQTFEEYTKGMKYNELIASTAWD